MNAMEIALRHPSDPKTEEEMIFVIKDYIEIKKGSEVEINLSKWIPKLAPNPIKEQLYAHEVKKLMYAFNEASKHYLNV